MSVNYSVTTINARLSAVITQIGSGILVLRQGGTALVSIVLDTPCGTANGGILTFSPPPTTGTVNISGDIDNAIITDGGGTVVVSGLSVGTPLSSGDIIISNGLNSTAVAVGQTVQMLAGQIVGS